jgi:hypothetical protein
MIALAITAKATSQRLEMSLGVGRLSGEAALIGYFYDNQRKSGKFILL